MKKYKLFSVLFLIFCFAPFIVNAEDSVAIIKESNVIIKESNDIESNNVYTLGLGTTIDIDDYTLVEGPGCEEKWYKVSYKNNKGYICSKYISFEDLSFDGISTLTWTSRVNGNNVAVRKSASTKSSTQDTLSLGVNVNILDTVEAKNSGCSTNKWYKIGYYSNKTGYICSSYVTSRNDITASDEEYTQVLKSAGFPDSYIPYLTYLHNKYPNWTFVAKKTGVKFNKAVSSEEGKNYMQTKNDNYRTSNKPAEGSSWFKVNSNVIAFYMDPRNFLSEERIFMFEKLDYENSLEESYPTLVKAIFGSGKLGADEYTIPMVNAGKANKISPVHIASRIRLEVGANGSDSTNGSEFTFKGKKYSGYYNFFNIGAYEQTINGVKYGAITRGLAYAAKLIDKDGNRSKWNNIEVAITEGSRFLANGYVNKGQGTLYYQKFNVSPDAYYNRYTHQYMTNIQAPATEGNQTYNSYKKAKILDQPFIFEIPIYNNMPDYTSLPSNGNKNDNLRALEISNYVLTPKFDKDVLSYEVYVPLSETKLTVNAIAESSTSSVSGTGEMELTSNNNDVTITVKSESGTWKKYVITIKKVDDNTNVENVLNISGIEVNNNYLTNIKNKTYISTLQNQLIKSGAKNVVIKNKNGDVLNNSDYLTTGSEITITTSLEEKTFTLVVNGDTSGDGKVTILDLLQIQKHIKGAKRLDELGTKAADTSGDGNITILDLLQVQKHLKGAKSL